MLNSEKYRVPCVLRDEGDGNGIRNCGVMVRPTTRWRAWGRMSDVGCAVGADRDQGQVSGEAEGNVTIGFLGTVESKVR